MKRILSLLSISILLFSCQEKSGNLHITGDIKGLSQGKVYIQKLQDSVLVPLDGVKLDNTSKFEFNLTIDEPQILYLYLDKGKTNSLDNNIMFYAEPGKVDIKTELDNFILKAKVTGNENQKVWEDYKAVMKKFNEKNLDLLEQKLHYSVQNQYNKVDSLVLEEQKLLKRKYQYAINYSLANIDKEIIPYLVLTDIYDANPKYLDSINKSMPSKVASSKYGKLLSQYVQEIKKNNIDISLE